MRTHCCASLKTNLFEVWFYTYFSYYIYIKVYSPGAGADNPLGSKVLYQHKPFVTLVICCKFLPLNDFLIFFSEGMHIFPYKSIRKQIWPCHKKGQGQPNVIIWTKFVGPKSQMPHTNPQGYWPFGSGEDFKEFIPYMGMAAILIMWTRPPPLPTNKLSFRRHMEAAHEIWLRLAPEVLEKKMFENGGRRRTTGPAYTMTSPVSLKAQVS